jgi:hypothetical protein
MNNTSLHRYAGILFSCMALSALAVACAQPTPTVENVNTLAPTSEPTTIPTQTVPSTPPAVPQLSSLIFSHVSGDAGNFYLLAGETITLTWENAPAGADKYEFVLAPLDQEPSIVLGSDVDDSDGVAVSWTIPEQVAAELHATAYFPDGRTTELAFAPIVYSGGFPPAGLCSLIARHQPVKVYRMPDRTAEVFALLYLAVYAHVLEIAPDGWYRIDASVAEVYTPPLSVSPDTGFHDVSVSVKTNSDLSPASGEGWVNNDKGVLLTGSCPPGGG